MHQTPRQSIELVTISLAGWQAGDGQISPACRAGAAAATISPKYQIKTLASSPEEEFLRLVGLLVSKQP